MAATHSAWVRQASLKESERKRKRQLLKINISPEMRSVFVCMYHFDDNNPFDSVYMCVRVCFCYIIQRLFHQILRLHHIATFMKCMPAYVLLTIEITHYTQLTSIYRCQQVEYQTFMVCFIETKHSQFTEARWSKQLKPLEP